MPHAASSAHDLYDPLGQNMVLLDNPTRLPVYHANTTQRQAYKKIPPAHSDHCMHATPRHAATVLQRTPQSRPHQSENSTHAEANQTRRHKIAQPSPDFSSATTQACL